MREESLFNISIVAKVRMDESVESFEIRTEIDERLFERIMNDIANECANGCRDIIKEKMGPNSAPIVVRSRKVSRAW